MTSRDRMTWLSMAIVTAGLIAILAFLYVKTIDSGEFGHYENIASLRLLKQLDAQWELNVLKSKSGVNKDYDALSECQTEVSALLDQLEAALDPTVHDDASTHASVLISLRQSHGLAS